MELLEFKEEEEDIRMHQAAGPNTEMLALFQFYPLVNLVIYMSVKLSGLIRP